MGNSKCWYLLVSILPAVKIDEEFFVEALGREWLSLVDRGIGIGIGNDVGIGVDMGIDDDVVDSRDGSVVDKMVDVVSTEVRSIGDPRSLGLLKTRGWPETELLKIPPDVGVLMKLTLP